MIVTTRCRRVVWRQSKKDSRQHAGRGNGSSGSHADADDSYEKRLAKDLTKYLRAPGTEGEPDADLARATSHVARRHTIEPHAGLEPVRVHAESTGQGREQALWLVNDAVTCSSIVRT